MSLRALLAPLALLSGAGIAVPAPAPIPRAEHTDTVAFRIVDRRTGEPFPARVHLKDDTGAALKAGDLPFHRTHFTCPGTVSLALAPGTYTWEIEHGPEFSLATGSVTVPPDRSPQSVAVTLERRFDLAAEGWWSGDLHVHRPAAHMELLMQAEDLHIAPVITWWNRRNLWLAKSPPGDTLVRAGENRFYDVMAGEDEREGGALLYFHLKQPLAIAEATREYPSPMKFLGDARAHAGVWVDIEKPFWWDVPVWLASGRVDSIGIANNHMTRDGIYSPAPQPGGPLRTEEAWGRPRDYDRLPSPHGNGLWSQEIYYHILNCGLRLPPSAGSASGVLPNPLGYNRVWVHLGDAFSYAGWWEGLRAGRSFVSNGPLLRVRANGEWPGHVFTAGDGAALTVDLESRLDGRDPIRVVEVIVNGHVAQSVPFADFTASGRLAPLRFEESGWFLVRAIADVDHTFRFASTAPWFVEIGEARSRISRESAQFFLDWVRERRARVDLGDPAQKAEVLEHHDDAEKFWQAKLDAATGR